MNIINQLLDNRVNTRGFSSEPISTEHELILLDTLNMIPCKENQMPTSVLVLGKNATKEKKEYFENAHCPSKGPIKKYTKNTQLLAPLVFLFYPKSSQIDGNGNEEIYGSSESIDKEKKLELHFMFMGFAAMALGLSAKSLGLSIGYSQSQGMPEDHVNDDGPWKQLHYNGEHLHIDFALGVGHPVNWTKNKYERIRQEPDEFKTIEEWASHKTSHYEEEALLVSNAEKSKRPELKTWVELVGCDIPLPQTWQNN